MWGPICSCLSRGTAVLSQVSDASVPNRLCAPTSSQRGCSQQGGLWGLGQVPRHQLLQRARFPHLGLEEQTHHLCPSSLPHSWPTAKDRDVPTGLFQLYLVACTQGVPLPLLHPDLPAGRAPCGKLCLLTFLSISLSVASSRFQLHPQSDMHLLIQW